MSTIITHGDDTIIPAMVLGYQSERGSRNLLHSVLGSVQSDVTLRPAGLRTGTIGLLFTGASAEADSKAAEDLHATGGIFVVLSDERATIDMSYVVQDGGRIARELDATTRRNWVLSVDFQEVSL